MKTLARIKQDQKLAGICSGFAYAFGIPTWITRLAAVVSIFLSGIGIPAYLLLWVFMPTWHMDPQDYLARTSPETMSAK